MKRILTYCIFIILLLSCRQQYEIASLSGTFEGVEGRNHPLAIHVSLELNKDMTFSLRKSFDLTAFHGHGEWGMLNSNVIEIKCNNNPVVSDIQKALMGGGFIEDTLTVKVLSKNKLRLGDVVLKRKD